VASIWSGIFFSLLFSITPAMRALSSSQKASLSTREAMTAISLRYSAVLFSSGISDPILSHQSRAAADTTSSALLSDVWNVSGRRKAIRSSWEEGSWAAISFGNRSFLVRIFSMVSGARAGVKIPGKEKKSIPGTIVADDTAGSAFSSCLATSQGEPLRMEYVPGFSRRSMENRVIHLARSEAFPPSRTPADSNSSAAILAFMPCRTRTGTGSPSPEGRYSCHHSAGQ
jgi:hypothetical protein